MVRSIKQYVEFANRLALDDVAALDSAALWSPDGIAQFVCA